jgi:hypothetical protein
VNQKLMRHPVSNKPILSDVVCVDDFGDMVFVCQYTGVFVAAGEAIFIGPVMPNVNGTYVCATDAMPVFRAQKTSFNELDANCNMCRHLERAQRPKNIGGFLFGRCAKGIDPKLYSTVDGLNQFHPEDYMGMTCWEARV